jgi:mannose/fructose/N-acetylgalactosamine-specific phosphotransferase system component IID
MFLSVMGFVIFGLFIIIGSIAITLSPLGSTFATFLPFLLMTFIYFFPIYYLFQFSRYSKKAFINLDSELLSIALKYLKMHYRFMGILVIVVFGIYLIMFLFMLVSGNYNNLF